MKEFTEALKTHLAKATLPLDPRALRLTLADEIDAFAATWRPEAPAVPEQLREDLELVLAESEAQCEEFQPGCCRCEATARIRAWLAAPKAPEAGWGPIETAQRGRRVLVGSTAPGKLPQCATLTMRGEWTIDTGEYLRPGYSHWMPLPGGPKG